MRSSEASSKRDSNTSEIKRNSTAPSESVKQEESGVVYFLASLCLSVFFATYGIMTLAAYKKQGVSPSVSQFSKQVLIPYGIKLTDKLIG